jgi:hypothetical protein
LPASQDDIGISRAKTATDAAGHFGRDQARARTEKSMVVFLGRSRAISNGRGGPAVDIIGTAS